MAHFAAYNSESTSAEKEGWVPLKKSGTEPDKVELGPLQTDRAQRIGGSVFTDQAGEILLQQSFDNGKNWDISTKVAVSASTGTKFSEEVIAPLWRVIFKNTASSNQTVIRLYARAFTTGN